MKRYELETMSVKEIQATQWQTNENEIVNNNYITETAGFIPLEVKFKRFEQAGIKNAFTTAEFDSADYRDMYLNPDFNITPEDELEEVQEKMQLQRQFIEKLKAAKSAGKNVEAGTEEPKTEEKKTGCAGKIRIKANGPQKPASCPQSCPPSCPQSSGSRYIKSGKPGAPVDTVGVSGLCVRSRAFFFCGP